MPTREHHPAYTRICNIWKKENNGNTISKRFLPQSKENYTTIYGGQKLHTNYQKRNHRKKNKYDLLVAKDLNDWQKFITKIKLTIKNTTNLNTYLEINQDQINQTKQK